jgi:signal recognition particle GTPase
VCTFIELEKKIQTIEGTISDLEELLLDTTLSQDITDKIFEKLRECDRRIECIRFKITERDLWCSNHISVTCKETQKEWYSGENRQVMLDI